MLGAYGYPVRKWGCRRSQQRQDMQLKTHKNTLLRPSPEHTKHHYDAIFCGPRDPEPQIRLCLERKPETCNPPCKTGLGVQAAQKEFDSEGNAGGQLLLQPRGFGAHTRTIQARHMVRGYP